MDEYVYEVQAPPNNIYRDLISLIAEHSITMTDTENKDILQKLIREEVKLVEATIEGNLVLIRAELREIHKNNKTSSNVVTAIK